MFFDQLSRLFLLAECTLFFLNALVAFNQSHVRGSLLSSLLSSAASSPFLGLLQMFCSSVLSSSSSPLLHLYMPLHPKPTWQRLIWLCVHSPLPPTCSQSSHCSPPASGRFSHPSALTHLGISLGSHLLPHSSSSSCPLHASILQRHSEKEAVGREQ